MGSEYALKNTRNFASLVSNISPKIQTLDSQKIKIDGQTSDGEVRGGDGVVSGDGNGRVLVAQTGGGVRKVHGFEKQGRIMMKFTQPKVVEGVPVDCGQVETFKLDSGLFVFRFESEELREKIIAEGSWIYSRRPLILPNWEPRLKMDRMSIEKLPVWFRFPGLSLEHYDLEELGLIPSTVEKSIYLDTPTMEMTRI
ncbi:hypothetical protein LIER_29098 [Lithospermum erythrorhizon]|uniref:DUF4283 domain-containing protein n=1 Tax=Lithospermum erythrorhizon TaxID=34254 RepID=A0AAV3RJJ7_LITER